MIPRYGRPSMMAVWTDKNRYAIWFLVERLAAEAMAKKGEIPRKAMRVLKRKNIRIDPERILEIEKTVKHDVISFLTHLEELLGPEARHLHKGLTSSDILDTALAVQLRQAGTIITGDLNQLKKALVILAKKHRHHPMVGRSHGIHAEPITFGLKVLGWVSEAERNMKRFQRARETIEVGKLSGAMGTFAHNSPFVEDYVCRKLHLKPEPLATQIVPRDRHAEFMTSLALVGGMLERIATEIRHLQRTEVLEVEEAFAKGQKGSSAMPHKRNPIGSENICGLSRVVRANAIAALENIPLWHERDISHSSVERVILPDTTLLIDYTLSRMTQIIKSLRVYPQRMKQNLRRTEEFLASEKILLLLVNKGLARQKGYELVQRNALEAWIHQKSFRALIERDQDIHQWISRGELKTCFNTATHFKHVDTLFRRVGV